LVGGGVVDDDYLIVRVVLVEDGTKVILIPESHAVIQSWHHYAEGPLRQVKIMLFAESLVFSPEQVIDLFLYVYVFMD
jgi:hypothetical protein